MLASWPRALAAAGRPAEIYHAGLPARQRRETADAFLEGRAQTIVATNAFGMGVDRPDVRAVLHAGPPTSVDQYFQEVGPRRPRRRARPGRAVLPARGLRPRPLPGVRRRRPTRTTWPPSCGSSWTPTARSAGRTLEQRTGLSRRRVAQVLGAPVAGDAVKRRRGGLELRAGARRDPASVVAEALAERDRRREFDRSRLDMIRAYAETTDCRRRVVLELLGEEYPGALPELRQLRRRHQRGGRRPALPDRLPGDAPGVGAGTVSHYEGDRDRRAVRRRRLPHPRPRTRAREGSADSGVSGGDVRARRAYSTVDVPVGTRRRGAVDAGSLRLRRRRQPPAGRPGRGAGRRASPGGPARAAWSPPWSR